jgi:hypothetical protein
MDFNKGFPTKIKLVAKDYTWTLPPVKFGSIDSHSPMRGHMGHPKASQGDLENQPIL